MATCKNCIHERVCYAIIESGLPYLDNDKLPAEAFCMTFKNKLDFVEVVRCRNCKYSHKPIPEDVGFVECLYCSDPRREPEEEMAIVGYDDFCSYGERKEE